MKVIRKQNLITITINDKYVGGVCYLSKFIYTITFVLKHLRLYRFSTSFITGFGVVVTENKKKQS